jgi:hypothetical protein
VNFFNKTSKSRNLARNSLKIDKGSKHPKKIQITSSSTEYKYAETTVGNRGEGKKHYQSQLPKDISRKEIAQKENNC